MPAPFRILIADENEASRELLEECLAEINCVLEAATDVQQTLEKIASFQPDLVLLDATIQERSGLLFCRQIKENPATRSIKVILMIALKELREAERAIAAGANDFITKPVNMAELASRVRNMLPL